MATSTRAEIAKNVRSLREGRGLTQVELSKRLGLSQGRYSEIERGQGSFTAEQFLEILKIFNVSVSLFASGKTDLGGEFQNALARFGASHVMTQRKLLRECC